MRYSIVKVLAEFIVNNDWDARKIIEHALAESEGVPYTFRVEIASCFNTPVSDEDMGQTCDACEYETERCPCKGCNQKAECCGLMDAEQRSKCEEFDVFLGGDDRDPFDECDRCAKGEEDCHEYFGDADGFCRNFVKYQYDVRPDGDVYRVFKGTGKDDWVWVADFAKYDDAEMYIQEKEETK